VAERAVRAVIDTATRVREQGVTGLLASSLDDLTRWATEDRAAITRVAAPDGTVTILFSDIVNSTEWNERLGDRRWVRVLEAHNVVVRREVSLRGGHVVKAQGDGFMVVFGEPMAGVRSAVAIQTGLARDRRVSRLGLRVRIGLHQGRTVVRDQDYFGRNVAMAARIAACAEGGEILVSDDVRKALGPGAEVEAEPVGEVELKGFVGTQRLWRVER
jgi:class 3 adenylate cyclase